MPENQRPGCTWRWQREIAPIQALCAQAPQLRTHSLARAGSNIYNNGQGRFSAPKGQRTIGKAIPGMPAGEMANPEHTCLPG